ncbi:hypothetical protein [Hyalangium sp.]|uniref:hypothetical protein n=1 Tax=Hyalangium sp. TaxID=2028555 RepID=UPI002D5F92E5|nr:hypothetical protein [Hyalangium sp.]HYH95500.1 hypothetical protein [Hyalangium sp.]
MRTSSMKELAHVAAMLSVLVIGVRCGTETEEPDHVHFTTENALLVSERSGLQVCVELDPALEGRSEELLGALKADLAALEQGHPDWQKAGMARAPVRLQLGCPGKAMPSERLESKGAQVGPGLSIRPSPFRTFIYVLDEAKASQVLGEQQAIRARAELMEVSDHQMVEVSTALVIRASALGTASLREEWLPLGTGLKLLREPSELVNTHVTPKFSGGEPAQP